MSKSKTFSISLKPSLQSIPEEEAISKWLFQGIENDRQSPQMKLVVPDNEVFHSRVSK